MSGVASRIKKSRLYPNHTLPVFKGKLEGCFVEPVTKLKQNLAISTVEPASINATIFFRPVDNNLSNLLILSNSDFGLFTVY